MHAFNLNPTTAIAAVALLSALPTAQASLYLKSSPVTQVDAKNFDKIINKSNHTSVVEFYAPWCGHCQNLKPAYEKAARNLDGLAHVAAVNCDEDENKQLCGMMGVKGFPTLKTVRPGKKGKPIVEDYNGPRTAKGIVDAVVEKINNHVKRVTDKDIDSFLSTKNETAKAILFTEKGTTSALLKSIAIDFLDVISVAQIRDKETKANELFGIKSYPTLVLLPGGDKESLVYDGELKKDAMIKFLTQAGEPNPDPAPSKAKGEKKGDKKSEKKDKKASPKSSDSSSKTTSTESTEPTDVPPVEKPVEVTPPIPTITEAAKLTKECLNNKAHTCVLAFVPSAHGEAAEKALTSLAELAAKHAHAQRHLFPFFEIHNDNEVTASVFKSLELAGEVEIVAVNGKRGWWRHYEGDFTPESVESWIDAIRLSEGTKKKIPDGVITEHVEPESESPSKGTEPTAEATKEAPKHEEL
ncbi:thioredoxin-domain-containing protein [Annulohypoxylon maeteangense]|uniref:thioredoxin-domain-containing protein n=1 Tax=Annulohypoxylon maeteangense TaxID=1927788 RepID=UPI0020074125|nr:thioredoxin-domain-containing protein [Annulohypoxylon maeteangense]KAI0881606.1 thioredoxin-domain-containing protein [Annulohypoxylon maeteangense]